MLYIQTENGRREVEIKRKITSENAIRVLQQAQTGINIYTNKFRSEHGLKLVTVSLSWATDPNDIRHNRQSRILDYSNSNNLVDIYRQVKGSVEDFFVGADDPLLRLSFVKDETIENFSYQRHPMQYVRLTQALYIWDPQVVVDSIIKHSDNLIEIDFENREDLYPLIIQGLPVLSKLERLKARNCNVPVSSLEEIIRNAPNLRREVVDSKPCIFTAPAVRDDDYRSTILPKKTTLDDSDESCSLRCVFQ